MNLYPNRFAAVFDACVLGGTLMRLEHIMSNPHGLQRHVWRARIILELGSG